MKAKNIILILSLAILSFIPNHTFAKKVVYPNWTTQIINDGQYYYGVGMAYKVKKKSTAHIVEAEKMALQKLSENISLSLKSNSILAQLETDSKTRDDLSSIIQVRTANDIQGYEKTETFETKEEYWILVRLSKTLYEKNEYEKHQKAISAAQKNIIQANELVKSNEIGTAVVAYAHALNNLIAYFNSSNLISINGSLKEIVPYAYSNIKLLLDKIILNAKLPSYTVVNGETIDSIICRAYMNDKPIPNIHIKANFENTSLPDYTAATNLSGNAKFRFPSSATSNSNTKIIFSLDLQSLFEVNNVDFTIRRWLEQLYSDKAETNIMITKANIFVNTVEKNLGHNLESKILKQEFENQIAALGYNIVNDIKAADFSVNIYSDTKLDYHLDNLYVSHLSLSIKITNKIGDNLFSGSMPSSRGVNTSEQRSGINAYYQALTLIKSRYIHIIEANL